MVGERAGRRAGAMAGTTADRGVGAGRTEPAAACWSRAVLIALATLAAVGTASARGDDALVIDPADGGVAGATSSAVPPAVLPAVLPVVPPAGEPVRSPAAARPGRAAAPYAGVESSPLFARDAEAARAIDESALLYYAKQRDRDRVDAEIARLKRAAPGWTPPTNLFSSGDGRDEKPLWDLFSAGRFGELRRAIALRQRQEAGWRPSLDLSTKLARAEQAAQVVALGQARDWAKLLDLASAHPDLVACPTIEVPWRVAEAFAALGLTDRATGVDLAILRACGSLRDRVATVQKAAAFLPDAALAKLAEAAGPAGAPISDPTAETTPETMAGTAAGTGAADADEVRAAAARIIVGRALAARADLGAIPGGLVAALAAATLRSERPEDASTLGWFYFGTGAYESAERWFHLAMARAPDDAGAVEGEALSLEKLSRPDEARAVSAPWRDRSDGLERVFVRTTLGRIGQGDAPGSASGDAHGDAPGDPVSAADLASLVATLERTRDAEGAASLGWAAYRQRDAASAVAWFAQAIAWTAGAPPDKLVEGYGLSLIAAGDLARADRVLLDLGDASAAARRVAVQAAVASLAPAEALAEGEQGPVRPALALPPELMARFEALIGAERAPDGAAALGWSALARGDAPLAVSWFRRAVAWGGPGGPAKDREGLILGLKAAGSLEEAEELAFAGRATSHAIWKLYRDVMAEGLSRPELAAMLSAARVERFAAEVLAARSSGGAQALGWYRLQTAPGCGYAVDWFDRSARWTDDHLGTAKIGEGLALALQRIGDDPRAADAAEAWAARSPDARALYMSVMASALTRQLFPPPLGEGRVGRYAEAVLAAREAVGAQALGWHRFAQAGSGYGVDWFRRAIAWSPDGRGTLKTVEGYALALRDVGARAAAEEVLFPWIDRAEAMRDLYIDTVISELTIDNPPEPMPQARIDRFEGVITPIRAAGGAQALGWYRFARREYAGSVAWFETATDWWPALPDEALDRSPPELSDYRVLHPRLAFRPEDYERTPRAYADAAVDRLRHPARYEDTFTGLATTWYGYALALQAVGRLDDASRIAADWSDAWDPMDRLSVDIAVTRLADPEAPPPSPEQLRGYEAAFARRRDAGGAAALGWAAVRREDWASASVWLKAAIDWAPARTADRGLFAGYVDALRRSGRPEEAFVAASDRAADPAMDDPADEGKYDAADDASDPAGARPAPEDLVRAAALDVIAAAAARGAADPAQPTGTAGPGGSAGRAGAAVLRRALAVAGDDPSAAAAAAVGWYRLAARQPGEALAGFRKATLLAEGPAGGPEPSKADAAVLPKAVEGVALSLRAAGRDADALAFAQAWSAKVGGLAAMPGLVAADLLSRDGGAADIAPPLLAKLLAAVAQARSPDGAAALGWYRYRRRDWGGAVQAFSDAVRWSPEARGTANVVEGLVASMMRQCRFEEAASAAAGRMGAADGTAALKRLYVDATASRLAFGDRGTPGARISRARSAGARLSAAEVTRFSDLATETQSAAGAEALGWYAYRAKNYPAARAWFERSVAWNAAEASEFGLGLALRRLGDRAALAAVAAERTRWPSLAVFLRGRAGGADPAVPEFGSRTCDGDGPKATETADRGAAGAVAGAEAAVEASAEAGAARGDGTAALAETLTEALDRLSGETSAGAVALDRPRATRARGPSPGQTPGRVSGPAASASAALQAKDYGRCLAILADRRSLTPSDLDTRGWCLLGMDRPSEADLSFRAAQAGSDRHARSDGALGDALSRLRVGQTASAAAAAERTELDPKAGTELRASIVFQQAIDAYQQGRWADALAALTERERLGTITRGMVMMRGWTLYHLGDRDLARRCFEQADAQLSDRDSRAALNVVTTDSRSYR